MPPRLPTMVDISEKTPSARQARAEARPAGIAGAKRASELIPLCHPLPLDVVGVEMEALAAAALAALRLYDMRKPLGPDMIITDLRLLEKNGGKDDYRREEAL